MKIRSIFACLGLSAITLVPLLGSQSFADDRPRDGERREDDRPRDGDQREDGRPRDGERRSDGRSRDSERPRDIDRPGDGERPRGPEEARDLRNEGRGDRGRPEPGPRESDRDFPRFGPPIMVALDIDRDGTISGDEIDMAVVSLRKLDRNHDGKLTREELMPDFGGGRPGFGGMREGERPGGDGDRPGPGGPIGGPRPGGFAGPMPPERMLEMLDRNDDGFLDRNEAPERMASFFDRADTSGDGKLDSDELRKIGERMGPMGNRRGPGNDQPDGPVQPRRPPSE